MPLFYIRVQPLSIAPKSSRGINLYSTASSIFLKDNKNIDILQICVLDPWGNGPMK